MFLTPRIVLNAYSKKWVKILTCAGVSSKKRASTQSYVVGSKLPDVEIPEILLHDYVWRGLEKWHDRTALECFETGRTYKYSELHKKSRALALFLRKKMGLQAGDTVAFVLRNVPEYVVAMLATYQANLKATTINPIYTCEEIKRQLVDSKAKVVFTLGDLYPLVQKSISEIPNASIPVVVIKHLKDKSLPSGAIRFEELCEGDHKDLSWAPAAWEDVAILPYSSGTTGMPKGVQLTHKSVVSNLCQWLTPDVGIYQETNNSHQDVIPCFLPMFHVYGIMVITLCSLSMGAKILMVPKFGSQEFLKLLNEFTPGILFAVPPVVLMLLNNPNFNKKHIEQIRTVVSSAAPLGAADIERFLEKTDGIVDFLQIYGMTEASPLILSQTKLCKGGVKIGGSGMLLPNTLSKIVDVNDDSNTGLGPLQSGELIFKGPQIMKGYLNNSKSTSEAIVDDGWLRTGDIAHYDEDGQYYITDRLKELIKVKGFQVAPAELEEILRDHPNVADAAVIGVSHPDFGEVPKAFVVLKKGTTVSVDNILEYVSSKVAKYKQLTGGVVLLESIPKTPSGKILRRHLKHM